jgi:5'/3'-nucleotidase
MRLLLTNDDGVASPGLHALARRLDEDGHDVIVAAPVEDMSGASAAIGKLHADEHIEVGDVELPSAGGVRAYAVSGPPGLAAMAACLGAFGEPPDVVVSGINAGLNTGHSILHSGTVGAALTAQNFGRCGIAVSVAPTEPWQWSTACGYAVLALQWLHDEGRARTVVNVNVPGCAADEVQGVRWAKLDQFGSVRAVAESGARGIQIEFRATCADLDPDSDTALVEAGYATFTVIRGVSSTDVTQPTSGIGAEPEAVTREVKVSPTEPASASEA